MAVNFQIGADPEIFLRRRGKAYSAHGVIPGTKKEPHKVRDGAIQVDGLAVEFNVEPTPLQGWGGQNTFNQRIISVIKQMKEKVQEHDKYVTFNIAPIQDFDPEYMAAQPPEAREMGCDPDYSAYTLQPNPRPDGEVNFRTAAGHIHLGWGADIPVDNPDHIKICADFIKLMDASVGMFMTIIDKESRRRELYGKAGAFRPKSYGVEYRTPSNVWLSNKKRRVAIYQITAACVTAAQYQYNVKRCTGFDENEIREIIDTGDFVRAFTALNKFLGTVWKYELRAYIKNEFDARMANVAPAE